MIRHEHFAKVLAESNAVIAEAVAGATDTALEIALASTYELVRIIELEQRRRAQLNTAGPGSK